MNLMKKLKLVTSISLVKLRCFIEAFTVVGKPLNCSAVKTLKRLSQFKSKFSRRVNSENSKSVRLTSVKLRLFILEKALQEQNFS